MFPPFPDEATLAKIKIGVTTKAEAVEILRNDDSWTIGLLPVTLQDFNTLNPAASLTWTYAGGGRITIEFSDDIAIRVGQTRGHDEAEATPVSLPRARGPDATRERARH